MPVARRAARSTFGLAAAAGVWGIGVERNSYAVRRSTLSILPSGSPTLTVLHLSDIHMAPWQRHKQRFIRRLAEFEPDLIIDTGDNLGHEIGLLGLKAALDPFRGVPGLSVWGSNDHWGPSLKNPFAYFQGVSTMPKQPKPLDLSALDAYFSSLGWTNLNNTAKRVVVKGVPLDVFGVDDPHRDYDTLDELPPKLARLRARKQQAALTIGVAHAPYRRILDSFADQGAELMFAGHTHGGQVCVPGYGALVTNCDIPRRQVKGLSTWTHGGHTAQLNVSAGLGTSIYAPVRFACRPEVTLLTLTAKA